MTAADTPRGELILYQTEDGRTRIECRFEGETIWLTQALMAELFQKDVRTINEHLVNIYDEGELTREATIRRHRIVRTEGKRSVSREVEHYNLEVILAVGFRVRSQRGTQFRRWANARLSEFLVKGFTMDDERLKNPPGPGHADYFDELLERIRDIRASERRFYQRCSTSTRPASTTSQTRTSRSSSSPPCRTRCTGPRTATRPPRSSTSVPAARSPPWACGPRGQVV